MVFGWHHRAQRRDFLFLRALGVLRGSIFNFPHHQAVRGGFGFQQVAVAAFGAFGAFGTLGVLGTFGGFGTF